MTRLLLVLALALLSGCYRLSAPPAMSEAVKLEISGNKTHLVRFQPYLQDEVAKALERQLGWRVSPTGTATLGLSIRLEDLDNTAKDDRGVAIRWRISMHGDFLLTHHGGNLLGTFAGVGSAAGLNDEDAALRGAAKGAASDLVARLEAGLGH